MRDAMNLAIEHWERIDTILAASAAYSSERKKFGAVYIVAFCHGYEHGTQSWQRQRGTNGRFIKSR